MKIIGEVRNESRDNGMILHAYVTSLTRGNCSILCSGLDILTIHGPKYSILGSDLGLKSKKYLFETIPLSRGISDYEVRC